MSAVLAVAFSLAALPLGIQLGAQDRAPVVLVFAGDVIFDAPIEYALRRSGLPREDAASYAPIFQDVAPVLSGADLAFVNLETPVVNRTRSRSDAHEVPTFAAPDAFLAALAHAGVDAIGVANNHAYDQGVAGLEATLSAAHALGLAAIGAGSSARSAGAATTLRVRGLDVALLQFSEATNWRVMDEEAETPRIALLSDDAIDRHVRAARAGGAALVVAMFHWSDGRDPDRVPSSRMLHVARLAASAGADLVVGHGTHMPAGSEVIAAGDGRAVPVLWSLGNLAAVMETGEGEVFGETPSVRDAWVARVRAEVDTSGRLEVRAIEIVPFWIDVSRAEDSLPFVRPLELERERGFVRSAACGAYCERLDAAYGRRGERAARASIADATVPGTRSESEGERPSTTSEAPADDAPPVESPRVATGTGERSSVGRRSTTGVAPELARGVELRIVFAAGRDHEMSIDEAQIGPIVALLRADRDLHAEVVAHPSPTEPDRVLGSRRARRIRGVIAIRGPSRSHLESRVGSIADHAYLELRVWR